MKKIILLFTILTLSYSIFAQVKSDADMGTYNNTYIKPNTTGAIKAQMHNTMNRYLINSKVHIDSLSFTEGGDSIIIYYYGNTFAIPTTAFKPDTSHYSYKSGDGYWSLEEDTLYNNTEGGGVKIYSDDSFGNPILRLFVGTDTTNDEALIKIPNLQNSNGTNKTDYPYVLVYDWDSDGKVGYLPWDSVGGGDGNWTLTGDDIENNNAGDVTLNGQVFVPDIAASGSKYSGNVAGIGTDDRLFPKSIIDLYNEQQDSLALVPTTRTTWVRDSTKAAIILGTMTDKVGIGTNAPTQLLDVRGNIYAIGTHGYGSTYEPFYFRGNIDTLDGNTYNLRSTMYYNNPDSTGYRIGGNLGEVYIKATSNDINDAVGQYAYIQHYGTGLVKNGVSFYAALANRSTGTIQNLYGLQVLPIDNSHGGTIGAIYGSYFADQEAANATTTYGIYQLGDAENYFGGIIRLNNCSDSTGIIYRSNLLYDHTYSYPGTTGYNQFHGNASGNLTMTGTASQASYNSGFGPLTLNDITTGYANTCNGSLSGQYITDGYNNTGVGKQALGSAVSMIGGTAIGANTLPVATGNYNTAVGAESQNKMVGGSYNSSLGFQSLYTNVSGNYNTAIGQGAGYLNTGSNNTFMGWRAGYLGGATSSNIMIGYRAGYNETGSSKSYWASDSTSWANGMASGSKLLWYADMSNAAKSNHFMNIFAKLSIGAAKNPNTALEVTGSAVVTGYIKSGIGSIADNDTSPDFSGYNTFEYQGSANSVSIVSIDNHVVGCYYTIIGNSNTYTITVVDGTPGGGDSFNLAGGNWVGGNDDVLVLYCISADNFIEVSRSDN